MGKEGNGRDESMERYEGRGKWELREHGTLRTEYRVVPRSMNLRARLSRCSSVRKVLSESELNLRGKKILIQAPQACLLYMGATGAVLLWSDRP